MIRITSILALLCSAACTRQAQRLHAADEVLAGGFRWAQSALALGSLSMGAEATAEVAWSATEGASIRLLRAGKSCGCAHLELLDDQGHAVAERIPAGETGVGRIRIGPVSAAGPRSESIWVEWQIDGSPLQHVSALVIEYTGTACYELDPPAFTASDVDPAAGVPFTIHWMVSKLVAGAPSVEALPRGMTIQNVRLDASPSRSTLTIEGHLSAAPGARGETIYRVQPTGISPLPQPALLHVRFKELVTTEPDGIVHLVVNEEQAMATTVAVLRFAPEAGQSVVTEVTLVGLPEGSTATPEFARRPLSNDWLVQVSVSPPPRTSVRGSLVISTDSPRVGDVVVPWVFLAQH